MKCMKCGKNIPDVSTTCPFCDHPVGVYVKDKDKITIPDEDDVPPIKFSGGSNSDNLELNAYIDEPEEKKSKIGIFVIIGLVIVIIILVIIMFMTFSNTSKKNDYHKFFTEPLNTLFNHITENYTGNYAISSGKYTINGQINYDAFVITGNYAFDTKDRIVTLTGKAYSNNNNPNEIVVDYNELNFEFYLRRDEATFSSNDIFDKAIIFPIDDEFGILSSKGYDLEAILNGLKEALTKGLEELEIKTNDDNINSFGISIDVNKSTITLNNEARRTFYKTIYKTLLDDSNFINEYARLRNISSDEMQEKLQELYDDADYTYPIGEGEDTVLSVYHQDGKLYRMEMIIHSEDSNQNIELDIGNDMLDLEIYRDGKNIASSSLEFSSEDNGNTIRKNYRLTYDDDDAQRTFEIEILKDKEPELKKMNFDNTINVRELTEQDYETIEENLEVFMTDTEWVKPFGASFANQCTPELNCNCPANSKTCSCSYNGTLITCNKEDVTKKEEEPTTENVSDKE